MNAPASTTDACIKDTSQILKSSFETNTEKSNIDEIDKMTVLKANDENVDEISNVKVLTMNNENGETNSNAKIIQDEDDESKHLPELEETEEQLELQNVNQQQDVVDNADCDETEGILDTSSPEEVHGHYKSFEPPSPESVEDEIVQLSIENENSNQQNDVVDCPSPKAGNDRSKNHDLPLPESEEDEEVRLAMEMAIAASQNPHLSPIEIQKLVGEKNAQAKMIDEFSKQNEEKIKMNQLKVKELQRQRNSVANSGAVSWWSAAAKKAEEIKDRAERSLYAEQISKDEAIFEIRKTMKILKKTLKAHRLQGNRVETRHVFKRQRMEKRLLQSTDKLKKTEQMFTNSNYNVQEYLKAMMRASKKWRKIGTDDELMLEAQLSRNMHQMLALEKQKIKCKKNTKELKKYLQRCKGWLSDKKAFCEMNIMTIDATQNSIMRLYEETVRRQDNLIAKYRVSDEFKDVDLSAVDLSHVEFPKVSYIKDVEQPTGSEPMRGLPINDSIRVTKGHLDRQHHHDNEKGDSDNHPANNQERAEQAKTRQQLLNEYYSHQEQQAESPELYVVANKDDESVSSRLSDPDASLHDELEGGEDSDDEQQYGKDAPWNASSRSRFNSSSSDDIEPVLPNQERLQSIGITDDENGKL